MSFSKHARRFSKPSPADKRSKNLSSHIEPLEKRIMRAADLAVPAAVVDILDDGPFQLR